MLIWRCKDHLGDGHVLVCPPMRAHCLTPLMPSVSSSLFRFLYVRQSSVNVVPPLVLITTSSLLTANIPLGPALDLRVPNPGMKHK